LGKDEDYNRISILSKSLKPEELLGLDVETVLHRLFWEEPLLRFEPLIGEAGPRFHCSCSRDRVGRMIKSLGVAEAESILSERENIEVACEFCGAQYQFDPVDAASLFTQTEVSPPTGPAVH
jgi:molecular chaperone Hsp33